MGMGVRGMGVPGMGACEFVGMWERRVCERVRERERVRVRVRVRVSEPE